MSDELIFNQDDHNAVVATFNAWLQERDLPEVSTEGDPAFQIRAFLNPIIEAMEQNIADQLPIEVITYYNTQFAEGQAAANVGDDDEGDEDGDEEGSEEAPKKRKKKDKKDKKPKEPKEPKEKKDRVPRKPRTADLLDEYGNGLETNAAAINKMLAAGKYVTTEIVETVGTTKSRLSSHLSSLKKKGFFLYTINGILSIHTEEVPLNQKIQEAASKEKAELLEAKKQAKAAKAEKAEKADKPKKRKKKKKAEVVEVADESEGIDEEVQEENAE